jgi:hypothetical protein
VCLRGLFNGTSRICELALIIASKFDDFWILLNENLNTYVRMTWEIYFYILNPLAPELFFLIVAHPVYKM